MFFLILTVALFVLAKLSEYYNTKYDGMYDGTPMSRWNFNYWRTADMVTGALYVSAMVSIWFSIKNLEAAQFVAVVTIMLTCLFLAMGAIVFIGEQIIEPLFGVWSWRAVKEKFTRVMEDYVEWMQNWSDHTIDMVGSHALSLYVLVICTATLWSMITILTPYLHK